MQVPTRKLPARKSPGLRGKRKRAADFFDGGSLAATDEDFLSGEASTPLVQSKSHGSKQGGSKGGAGSDVLEKAYHAATALAVVQTSHTDGFPTPRRKYASDDDAPPESSHSHLDEQRSLFRAPPEGTQDSDGSSSEAVSAKRSEKHIAVPREASGQVESIQKGSPNTAPDKGARAVEAEGLIWVDNSQATAYSVRYILHEVVKRVIYMPLGSAVLPLVMQSCCRVQASACSCHHAAGLVRFWQARLPD